MQMPHILHKLCLQRLLHVCERRLCEYFDGLDQVCRGERTDIMDDELVKLDASDRRGAIVCLAC